MERRDKNLRRCQRAPGGDEARWERGLQQGAPRAAGWKGRLSNWRGNEGKRECVCSVQYLNNGRLVKKKEKRDDGWMATPHGK